MKGVIYKYQPNEKMYIGKTYTEERRRKKQHKYDAFTKKIDTPFANAIRKYGWDKTINSYEVVEIIESDNLQDLNQKLVEREIYWINKLNTIAPNGYNVQFSNHFKIPTIINREEKNKKISESLKGKYMNDPRTSQRVKCIETQKEYPSVSECERDMGFTRGTICHVLNGNSHSHKGYTFEYLDKETVRKDKPKPRNKPIRCIETNEVFENARELSFALCGDRNKIRPNILASCKNGWSCRGKHYEFV